MDRAQANTVLDRLEPFNETTMTAHVAEPTPAEQSVATERAAQSVVLEDVRNGRLAKPTAPHEARRRACIYR